MPYKMKIWSIWVVWAFIAIGALGWALFVVLAHFDISDKAGWVQAIGAVLAIIGAAAFPYWHERDKARARAIALDRTLIALAERTETELRNLKSVLQKVIEDIDDSSVQAYIAVNQGAIWPHLVDAMKSIPTIELPAERFTPLAELKIAAEFGENLASRLPDRDHFDAAAEAEERMLDHHIVIVKFVAGNLWLDVQLNEL